MRDLDWAALAAWVTILIAGIVKLCQIITHRYKRAIERAITSGQYREDMNALKQNMEKVLEFCRIGDERLSEHAGRLERIEKHLELNGHKRKED